MITWMGFLSLLSHPHPWSDARNNSVFKRIPKPSPDHYFNYSKGRLTVERENPRVKRATKWGRNLEICHVHLNVYLHYRRKPGTESEIVHIITPPYQLSSSAPPLPQWGPTGKSPNCTQIGTALFNVFTTLSSMAFSPLPQRPSTPTHTWPLSSLWI